MDTYTEKMNSFKGFGTRKSRGSSLKKFINFSVLFSFFLIFSISSLNNSFAAEKPWCQDVPAYRYTNKEGASVETYKVIKLPKSYIDDFIITGSAESGFFDEGYYSDTNPDLGDEDKYTHFVNKGRGEGRSPNKYVDLDEEGYPILKVKSDDVNDAFFGYEPIAIKKSDGTWDTNACLPFCNQLVDPDPGINCVSKGCSSLTLEELKNVDKYRRDLKRYCTPFYYVGDDTRNDNDPDNDQLIERDTYLKAIDNDGYSKSLDCLEFSQEKLPYVVSCVYQNTQDNKACYCHMHKRELTDSDSPSACSTNIDDLLSRSLSYKKDYIKHIMLNTEDLSSDLDGSKTDKIIKNVGAPIYCPINIVNKHECGKDTSNNYVQSLKCNSPCDGDGRCTETIDCGLEENKNKSDCLRLYNKPKARETSDWYYAPYRYKDSRCQYHDSEGRAFCGSSRKNGGEIFADVFNIDADTSNNCAPKSALEHELRNDYIPANHTDFLWMHEVSALGEPVVSPRVCDDDNDYRGTPFKSVCTRDNSMCKRPFIGAAYYGNVRSAIDASTSTPEDARIKLKACVRHANTDAPGACGSRNCKLSDSIDFNQSCGYDNCVDLEVDYGMKCKLKDEIDGELNEKCAVEVLNDIIERKQAGDDGAEDEYLKYVYEDNVMKKYRLRSVLYGNKICVFLDESGCGIESSVANENFVDDKFTFSEFDSDWNASGENYESVMDGSTAVLDDGTPIDDIDSAIDRKKFLEKDTLIGYDYEFTNEPVYGYKWNTLWQTWGVVQYAGDGEDGYYTRDGTFIPNQQCAKLPIPLDPPRFYKVATPLNSPGTFYPVLAISEDYLDSDYFADFYNPGMFVEFGYKNFSLNVYKGSLQTPSVTLKLDEGYSTPYPTSIFRGIKKYTSLGPRFCVEQEIQLTSSKSEWIEVGCVKRSEPNLKDFTISLIANTTYKNPEVEVKLSGGGFFIDGDSTVDDSEKIAIGEVATNPNEAYSIRAEYGDDICHKLFDSCIDDEILLGELKRADNPYDADIISQVQERVDACNTGIKAICRRKGGLSEDLKTVIDPKAYGIFHEICVSGTFKDELPYVLSLVSDTELGNEKVMGKCVLDNTSKTSGKCYDTGIDFNDFPECNSENNDSLSMPDYCFSGGYNFFSGIGGETTSCKCQKVSSDFDAGFGRKVRRATLREAGMCADLPKAQVCNPVEYVDVSGSGWNPADPKYDRNDGLFGNNVHYSHILRTEGSTVTDGGAVNIPVVGHAEFAIAKGGTSIDGACYGFWKNQTDANGLSVAPRASCGDNGQFSLVSGTECERYSCEAIDTEEPEYTTSLYNLKSDTPYSTFATNNIAYYDETEIDNNKKLTDEDNRGDIHGYAMWPRFTKSSDVDGDYPELVKASKCITGFAPKGSNDRIYNKMTNEVYIKDKDKLREDVDKIIRGETIGGGDNLEDNLPRRYCSQKGKWMNFGYTPTDYESSCERLSCHDINLTLSVDADNILTDWQETGGALWHQKYASRVSLGNINLLDGVTNSDSASDINDLQSVDALYKKSIAEGYCDSANDFYSEGDEFYASVFDQIDVYNKYSDGTLSKSGYSKISTYDYAKPLLINDQESKEYFDVLIDESASKKLNPIRVCNEWGLWGPVERKCVKACPIIIDSEDSDIDAGGALWKKSKSSEGTVDGVCDSSKLYVKCSGCESPSRDCQDDGTWGDISNKCVKADVCPIVDEGNTVWNMGSELTVSDIENAGGNIIPVNGTCKSGYKPKAADGNLSRDCNIATGTWESLGADNYCEPIQCSMESLTTVANGGNYDSTLSITSASVVDGTEYSFKSCESGYELARVDGYNIEYDPRSPINPAESLGPVYRCIQDTTAPVTNSSKGVWKLVDNSNIACVPKRCMLSEAVHVDGGGVDKCVKNNITRVAFRDKTDYDKRVLGSFSAGKYGCNLNSFGSADPSPGQPKECVRVDDGTVLAQEDKEFVVNDSIEIIDDCLDKQVYVESLTETRDACHSGREAYVVGDAKFYQNVSSHKCKNGEWLIDESNIGEESNKEQFPVDGHAVGECRVACKGSDLLDTASTIFKENVTEDYYLSDQSVIGTCRGGYFGLLKPRDAVKRVMVRFGSSSFTKYHIDRMFKVGETVKCSWGKGDDFINDPEPGYGKSCYILKYTKDSSGKITGIDYNRSKWVVNEVDVLYKIKPEDMEEYGIEIQDKAVVRFESAASPTEYSDTLLNADGMKFNCAVEDGIIGQPAPGRLDKQCVLRTWDNTGTHKVLTPENGHFWANNYYNEALPSKATCSSGDGWVYENLCSSDSSKTVASTTGCYVNNTVEVHLDPDGTQGGSNMFRHEIKNTYINSGSGSIIIKGAFKRDILWIPPDEEVCAGYMHSYYCSNAEVVQGSWYSNNISTTECNNGFGIDRYKEGEARSTEDCNTEGVTCTFW